MRRYIGVGRMRRTAGASSNLQDHYGGVSHPLCAMYAVERQTSSRNFRVMPWDRTGHTPTLWDRVVALRRGVRHHAHEVPLAEPSGRPHHAPTGPVLRSGAPDVL